MNIFFKKLKSFLPKNDSRAVVANTIWLFSDKVFRQGLNFLLTAYIAKYLGAEAFGLWNYAIAFVMIFSSFSTLGLYSQLSFELIKYPERRNELLGAAFLLRFMGGWVTVLVSYVLISIFKPGEHSSLSFLVFAIAIGYVFQSLDVLDFFFQTQLKSNWIAISRLISFIVFASLKLLFVYLKFPLVYFVWLQAGEYFLATLFFIGIYNRYVDKVFHWVIKWKVVSQLFIKSLPLLFSEITILIYMKVDQIMIGEILGNKDLGIFSSAARLSEICYFVPTVICSSLFPFIIKAHSLDINEYNARLQKLYDMLVWISILLIITVSVLSKYIIVIIYGEEFIQAGSILMIHIWTSLFVYVGVASGQQLVVENMASQNLYRTILGVLVNVILNLLLIPTWGIAGAAIATLITQAIVSWISLGFYSKTQNMFRMILNALNPIRIFKTYLT